MARMVVRDLAFSFSDAQPLLAGVDLDLTPGWWAVVGPNGAGKSTLLRLLSGELRPAAGAVRTEPPSLSIGRGDQTVDAAPAGATSLLEDAEGGRLASLLGLDPGDLPRWPTLSPGERRRWQLAFLLAAAPDVLLLDEPENHLDARGRELLVGALRRFRGVGVVVTHDRRLARELGARAIRVDGGRVDATNLPYDEARATWAASRARAAAERAQWKAEIEKRERALGHARRVQASAVRSTSSAARMRDRHDHDARSAGEKTLASWAAAKASRVVSRRRDELARACEREPAIAPARELGRSVFLRWSRAPSARLAHLDARVLGAGERPLLRDVRLTWSRDERIHLAGPNGAGKSTLLRALVAGATSATIRVVPQELDEAARDAALAALRAAPPEERGRVLSLVAALGADPDRILASRALSPGEARKLALAGALGSLAHAIALDEPTHHLDLPSVERLEAALIAWPGPLLLVTHDADLAGRVTSRRWTIAEGTVV